MHADRDHRLAGVPVQRRHRLDDLARACPRLEAALERGAHDAGADRLGQEQHVARPARRSLRTTLSGWTTPKTDSPNFGSSSSIVWPPTVTAPASATFSAPPRTTSPTMSAPKRAREREQVHRGERAAAHRVDVGERVGGGDATEVVGVVDDGREEVDRQQRREVVGQPVDGRVVAGLEAEQERVGVTGSDLVENGLEVRRTPLRGSTRLARQLGEPDSLAVAHRRFLSQVRTVLRLTVREAKRDRTVAGQPDLEARHRPPRSHRRSATRRWIATLRVVERSALSANGAWLRSTSRSSASP